MNSVLMREQSAQMTPNVTMMRVSSTALVKQALLVMDSTVQVRTWTTPTNVIFGHLDK